MTFLTATDTQAICRVRLTGEGRWVSLALSLRAPASDTGFLARSDRLVYEVAGVDEAARRYGLANWQGGVLSGARYAFRALKAPTQPVCLHELRGQLGSGDVWAVSSAAAAAVARLLDRPPEFPLELGGWKMEEELWRPNACGAGSTSQNEKAVPSSQEPAQQESPAEKGDIQDLSTGAGVT